MLKTPFPHYRGNKGVSGLFQAIIGLMPTHDTYVELCVGSGQILIRKKPATLTIANDIDPMIHHRWKQLYGPSGEHSQNKLYFSNCDAQKLIPIIEKRTDSVLLYCDLPYLKESRRSDIDIYNYESCPAVHKAILNYAAASKHHWIISHYASELYSTILDGWNNKKVKVSVRGKIATEWIWFNFSGDIVKHDYKFHGDNFTKRQQHKRKLQRLINKLSNLRTDDRDYLLSQLPWLTKS